MKNENIAKYRDEFISSQIEAPNLSVGISLATLFSIAEVLQVPASKLLEFD